MFDVLQGDGPTKRQMEMAERCDKRRRIGTTKPDIARKVVRKYEKRAERLRKTKERRASTKKKSYNPGEY